MSKLLLRISALFMCILIYVQGICPFFSYPSPKHKIDYDELISSFYNPKGRIMSMAHRGDWKNYPENSLPSIQACIDMGVDIVEIDIQRTSDGVLVLSHDEKIDRMTNGSGKIEEMTYSEINKFYLKNGKGGWSETLTEYKIPTLDEVLKLCKGKIMLDLDKAMDYRNQIYDILEANDCLDIGIFVEGITAQELENWFSELKKENRKLPVFCCKIKEADMKITSDYLNGYVDAKTSPMLEMSFIADDWATAQPEMYKLAGSCMRIIGTTLGGEQCAGRKDDETGWAYLINLGCSVMQTDHIQEFVVYENAVNSIRNASEKIEAEHFNFSDGTKVSLADKNLNKELTDIGNGDSAEYRKINFGSGKNKITFNLFSVTGGKVEIFVDGVYSSTVKIRPTCGYQSITSEICNISGTHDIRFLFKGNKISSMAIDFFSFE